MIPRAQAIDELVVAGTLDLRWLKRLRARHPRSRTVLWSPVLDNLGAMRSAVELARELIVQDSLSDELGARLDRPVRLLSDFDPALARSAGGPPSSGELGPDAAGVHPVQRGPVLFCPSNDTHTKLFEPIARKLSDSLFLLHDTRPEERARQMLEELRIPYREGGAEQIASIRPSVVVVGNDWYELAWRLFQEAWRLGIPTACIQEGCLDFEARPRMRRCDYPLVQGPIMLEHLSSHVLLLTGNPRFDPLKSCALPAEPLAMLNCNFTYGVEEGARDLWVHGVAAACEEVGIEFFLSQHPRDRGEFPSLPVRRSHAGVVHDHLADSSILVTRFSTLVYEALACGRQVIYYNPHGEKMRLFNEDVTGGIHVARDYASLVEALSRASQPPSPEFRRKRDRFIALHCGEVDGAAARRCAAALVLIGSAGNPRAGRPIADRWEIWKDRHGRRLGQRARALAWRLRPAPRRSERDSID